MAMTIRKGHTMKIRRRVIRFLCLLGLWVGVGLQAHAQTDTVTYVYTDPQGTPLVKADAQGNVIARYDYTPYGNAVASLGSPPNGPGYTGHVNDPETGLVYMQARYYNPAVGRFLSTDPMGASAGDLFGLNRYAYVNNNPIGNTDPTGMAPGDSDDFYHSAYPVEVTTFASGSDGGGSSQQPKGPASSPPPSGVKQTLIGLAKPVMNLLDDIAAVMGDSEASKAPPLTPSNPSQAVGMMVGGVIVGAAEAAATDGESLETNTGGLVDITSLARRDHVLTGDANGGGHLFPGLPRKTPFPQSWSEDRIMHEISDVATDPAASRTAGRGGTTIVRGTRDGVEIQVIVRNGQIVTGYPINLPRNP
jgi:RHS repeat-associated core domain